MNTILMHGPAFDDSGMIVERQVPEADVPAFAAANYVIGAIPVEDEQPEVAAEVVAEDVVEAPKKRGRKAK